MPSKSIERGGVAALVLALLPCWSIAQVAVPAPPPTLPHQEPSLVAIQFDPQLTNRFAAAPPDVLAIAREISQGAVPSQDAIEALDDGDLQRSFSQPSPRNFPTLGHNLLREAAISANAPAALALMEAGADPFFNQGELPFIAVQTPSAGKDRAFPDYSDGAAIIAEWLRRGGNPNATWPGGGGDALLMLTKQNNLEAMLLLLDAGADPWLRTPLGETFGDMPPLMSTPFHLSNANAAAIDNEFAFRLAQAGHYATTPSSGAAELDEVYARTAAQYLGATGEENLRTVWRMQMALRAIYDALNRPMPRELRKLMEMRVPDALGGFWLAPGEVRSPDDPDQVVNAENQWGNELWHGND